jgi:hypothetical protein
MEREVSYMHDNLVIASFMDGGLEEAQIPAWIQEIQVAWTVVHQWATDFGMSNLTACSLLISCFRSPFNNSVQE